jgi:hypothetical protein
MKNIMKNNNIAGALTAVLFVSVFSFGALGFAPAAHAQYDSSGDYSGGCCGGVYPDTSSNVYPDTSSYVYPDTTSNVYPDTTSNVYPDTSSTVYPDTTSNVYPDTTSNVYPDTSTPTYTTGGYTTGGYTTGGYTTGGYTTGSGYVTGGGGYSTPSYTNTYAPTNTTIYSPTNTTVTDNTTTNTCTGNSCNTTITNPAPVINNNNVIDNYTPPATTQTVVTQQYCQSGYSGTYPNCYLPQPVYSQPVAYQSQPLQYQQPLAYNTAPYVSLSQVPYTGLDLGFWGSIAYWGAFVLFALFAAYLIAIKRVQNNIANYLKSVLFGADEEIETTTDAETAPQITATPAPVAVATTNGDMIDSFIMSQINRARHA